MKLESACACIMAFGSVDMRCQNEILFSGDVCSHSQKFQRHFRTFAQTDQSNFYLTKPFSAQFKPKNFTRPPVLCSKFISLTEVIIQFIVSHVKLVSCKHWDVYLLVGYAEHHRQTGLVYALLQGISTNLF